jgi:putative transposon-encoded protein
LASQGGNADQNVNAHAQTNVNNNKFDAVEHSLEKQVKKFGQATKSIKTFAEAVAEIRKDVVSLKKRSAADDLCPKNAKKQISLRDDYDLTQSVTVPSDNATVSCPKSYSEDDVDDGSDDNNDNNWNDPLLAYLKSGNDDHGY